MLFTRLGVFLGGWTLDATAQVCNAAGDLPGDMLDGLQALVDHSLIQQNAMNEGGPRFTMLETLREYALERLDASGEAEAVRRQHAEYFLALADAGGSSNPRQYLQPGWLDRMETEYDNLRAALTWSQSVTGSAELGLRLAVGMTGAGSDNWSEARNWLESALAHADAEGMGYPQARAKVLWKLGEVLAHQGDYAAGQAHMAHSLRLFQELGDLPWSAFLLEGLGWLAREQGDATTARALLEESLALFRELGDESGMAAALVTLGQVAVMQEDAAWATALLEEGLALSREVGNLESMGWALNHLGHVAQLRGEYGRARRLHEESLPLFREIDEQYAGVAEAHRDLGETALAEGDAALATTHFTEALQWFRRFRWLAGVSWCLAGLAGVAALNEEPERAAWLWAAAEALRQSIGTREAPASRATRERLIAQAREQLGEAAFAAAWEKGQAASTEQAIAEALATDG